MYIVCTASGGTVCTWKKLQNVQRVPGMLRLPACTIYTNNWLTKCNVRLRSRGCGMVPWEVRLRPLEDAASSATAVPVQVLVHCQCASAIRGSLAL